MSTSEQHGMGHAPQEHSASDRRSGTVPRVTVLMTYYNKGRHVEAAIRSVLANTFKDLEILVVDDASTDHGLARVRALAAELAEQGGPHIRILESTVNTGRAAAANRGLDAARGEYIAVLDADDIMHPERIAKQVAMLDADPELGACGSHICVLGAPERITPMYATDRECRGVMLFGMPVIYGATTFRRSVIEKHGLRCIPEWRIPGMDYLFALAVGQHARYANVQEVLLEYRMGDNNMRHGRDPMDDRFALERATFDFFGIPATDAEVELHLAFHRMVRGGFDAARVQALWAWMQKLITWNRSHGTFTPEVFEAELHRRWTRLFHLLADESIGAAMAHMRLTGNWSVGKVLYAMKVAVRRVVGAAH